MYNHFTQCLTGVIKTSWEETLESDYALESQRAHANWDTAQEKFMEHYLNDKEYSPTIHYIKCPLNVILDTFSRLRGQKVVTQPLVGTNTDNIDSVANNENKGKKLYESSHSLIGDPALAQCFLAL